MTTNSTNFTRRLFKEASGSFAGAAAKGALLGGSVGGIYGAARGAVRERRKPKSKRNYLRAAAEGAMDTAPRAALVTGGANLGRHAYTRGKANLESLRREIKGHSHSMRRTVDEVGRTAKQTAESIQRTERHLKRTSDDLHRVVKPVGDSMDAMKRRGVERKNKGGHISKLLKRMAARRGEDFLAKGHSGRVNIRRPRGLS